MTWFFFGVLLLLANIAHAAADSNFVFITPEVDDALSRVPAWFWDDFSIVCILLGALFALVGSKLIRTQATFYAACVGGGFSAFVLSLIPGIQPVNGEVWLSVVIINSIVFGYIIGKIAGSSHYILLVAFVGTIAFLFNRYLVIYFVLLPFWLPWTICAVLMVLGGFLFLRYLQYASIVSTSAVGAFVITLASARLLRVEISLARTTVCSSSQCWIPFLIGACVFVIGAGFQLWMKRREERAASGVVSATVVPIGDAEEQVVEEENAKQQQQHEQDSGGNPFADLESKPLHLQRAYA